jgi:hypothetical protein
VLIGLGKLVELKSGMLAVGMMPDSSDGVDVTLIRWMLSLTPAERLEAMQGFADALQEARVKDADGQLSFDPRNAG